MAGLTADDNAEREEIKRSFVNSGASRNSRIVAIQRLTKECSIGMDNAEALADHWWREYMDGAQKADEKYTIGDAIKSRIGRRER
jgi:hypothetical protein